MISFSGIKNILWDFDGVILDSMFWRQHGFSAILNNYPSDKVDILLDYHRTNGGLSRYHKLRYFFEEIMCQPVSDAQIQTLANAFSDIMRVKLTDPGLLIKDCLSYIDANYHYYCMHIVSGSDQDELRYLCDKLNISHYFHSIYGSPTSKVDNVSNLLEKYN
jgi:phosphoglycolate phosphatase-like HAD superfamily hydrolase